MASIANAMMPKWHMQSHNQNLHPNVWNKHSNCCICMTFASSNPPAKMPRCPQVKQAEGIGGE